MRSCKIRLRNNDGSVPKDNPIQFNFEKSDPYLAGPQPHPPA